MRQSQSVPPPLPSNGAATTSLTCAILGLLPCLPAVGSIVAIPFAVAGLKRAARLEGRGKRAAAAGLALGIIGIGFWCMIAYFLPRVTGPAIAFIRAVDAGDIASARANATTSLTDAKVEDLRGSFQSAGKLRNATWPKVTLVQDDGASRIVVSGTGDFANGRRVFRVVLLYDDGSYKVDDMTLE